MKSDGIALRKNLFEWVDAMMAALAVLMVVFCFFVKLYSVNGTSMTPTLVQGDRILILDCFYSPRAGDVVVVDEDGPYGQSLVKRVVAVENQTVFIDAETGALYVDGALMGVDEGNIFDDEDYEAVVPEGCCFIMGDNRDVSFDSRYPEIGFIDNALIMGRAVYVFYSGGGAGAMK